VQARGDSGAVDPSAAIAGPVKPFVIAQISDLHTGSPFFVPNLMERAIVEINELAPDVVAVTGDLTNDGFRQEYLLAKSYLERIECPRLLVIPGNHDSRNVGYVHFEELFGARSCHFAQDGISIVGVDSTEPDLDYGTIGRARYRWLEEQFAEPAVLRIFLLHHHLLPVPGTGRERNMVYDAGDTLEVLQRIGVNLVLCGHKHVPYAWRLEDLFVVNAGTVSSLRLRGFTRPCYNVVTIADDTVTVMRKYPFHGSDTILEFSLSTLAFYKPTLDISRHDQRDPQR
jgi:3',5'-cyclic AMP phosphodiesterase CpdA